MANHYQILDVDTDADQVTIKAAYRKLSRRYHPDITGDTNGHLYGLVNEAYSVLSNEKSREDYDRTLNNGPGAGYSYRKGKDSEDSQSTPKPGNDSAEIPYPKVNWNSMPWFTRDYSATKEHVVLPRQGWLKGLLGGGGYILGMFLMGLMGFLYYVSALIPLTFILSIIAIIGWFKYTRYSWGKAKFGAVAVSVPAVLLGSMLFGPTHGNMSIWVVIIMALIGVGTVWVGFWSAVRWQFWQHLKFARGPIVFKVKDILQYVSWGKAGQLDDATAKFGERNVALGATGEKMTAELMQQLLKIPGTRIFHGLKFPGSATADVDHAIINGNKIVLVDSKMWLGGNYRWGYDGMITRSNGSTSSDLHTNFPHAVMKYQDELLEAQIRGRILIHSNNGRAVTVDNRDAGEVEMCTVQEFFEETGEWFAEDNTGSINRGLMNALLYRMK